MAMAGVYPLTTLKHYRTASGIPVYMESLDHLRSATVGVWVRVGSRDERRAEYGISHLVEHMLFKGTKNRKALRIAEGLDAVGGDLNAFTTREYSCYYARSAAEHFPKAMDLLGDIVFGSVFPEKEFEKEKKVVLEEIKMYEDNPEEQVHDMLTQAVFDAPLGHSIVGTRKVIAGADRDAVFDYYRQRYVPSSMIVSIVGNIPEKILQKGLSVLGTPIAEKVKRVRRRPTAYKTESLYQQKEIEQLHLALGYPGLSLVDDGRYVLHLISEYLGGGMSSRLFQEVRERHALAYSVYSFVQSYQDAGFFGIYCGTDPNRAPRVVSIVEKELRRLCDKGLSAVRLKRLKDQMKGSLTLNLERTNYRMTRLGLNMLYFGRVLSVDEILAKIDAVDLPSIRDMSHRILSGVKPAVAGVGPLPEAEFKAMVAGL